MNIFTKSGFIAGTFLAISLAILFVPFEATQSPVVGKEIDTPCQGIIGLRNVSFVQETSNPNESLSHHKTLCLFNIALR